MATSTVNETTSSVPATVQNGGDSSGSKSSTFPVMGSFWMETKSLFDDYLKTIQERSKNTFANSELKQTQMDALQKDIKAKKAEIEETQEKKGMKKGGFIALLCVGAVLMAVAAPYLLGAATAAGTLAMGGTAATATVAGSLGASCISEEGRGYVGALFSGNLENDGTFEVDVLDNDEKEKVKEQIDDLSNNITDIGRQQEQLMTFDAQQDAKDTEAVRAMQEARYQSMNSFTQSIR